MPRPGSKREKYAFEKTSQLIVLRDNVKPKIKVTRMAEYFDVGRETVTDWENGYSKPQSEKRYRPVFLLYLIDILKLKNDINKLERIWEEIMVELWDWQPISDSEFSNLLPGQARSRREIDKETLPRVGIPRQKYKLIGRQELVRTLRQRLMDRQMIALLGLPGVGKTALAVELTKDKLIKNLFAHGIFWVGLGRHPDILSELRQLAIALGVTEKNVLEQSEPSILGKAIHRAIGDKQILLILDDVWQVQTANLFTVGGENCAYLITTRIPAVASDFSIGHEIRVPELQPKAGLELLHLLAQSVVAEHPERAKKLANVVGHLPLALILMGNYLRKQALTGEQEVIVQTLNKLTDRIERLQLPESQRSSDLHPSLPVGASISLMAMIEISDQALDKMARNTLRALSVFPPKPNTFSEAAAASVSTGNSQSLNSLYQAGILEMDMANRYTLHQIIADYARANLIEIEPCGRFVDFFVDYIKTNHSNYDLIQLDMTNILAALKMARRANKPKQLVDGAENIFDFLKNQGVYKEAKKILTRAVKAARFLSAKEDLAKALRNLAVICEKLGEWNKAIKHHQEALEIVKELNDTIEVCVQLSNIAVMLQKQGKYKLALTYYNESLALAEKRSFADVINRLQLNIGTMYTYLGDYDLAQINFDQSLPWARQARRPDRLIPALGNLGWLMEKLGQYEKASIYYEECLATAQEVKSFGDIAKTFGHLGTVRLKQSRLQEAIKLHEQGRKIAEKITDRELLAVAYSNLGQVHTWQGAYDLAIKCLEDSLAIACKLSDQRLESEVRKNLGEIHSYLGNNGSAFYYLKDALRIARAMDYKENISSTLSILAALSLELGESAEKICEYLVEAFAVAHNIHHHEITAHALLGLVRVMIRMNDDEYSQLFLEEGKAIAHQLAHNVLLCKFLIEQGQLHLRRQDKESAQAAFVEALSVVKETGIRPVIAEAHFALAQGYQILDKKGMARREGNTALKIFKSLSHIYAQAVQMWLNQLD